MIALPNATHLQFLDKIMESGYVHEGKLFYFRQPRTSGKFFVLSHIASFTSSLQQSEIFILSKREKIYRNCSHSNIFIAALNWSFLFSSFPLDGLALNTTDLCVVSAFSHMRS